MQISKSNQKRARKHVNFVEVYLTLMVINNNLERYQFYRRLQMLVRGKRLQIYSQGYLRHCWNLQWHGGAANGSWMNNLKLCERF